ncbi:MAG: Ig-like domain-containing protein [Solirubrobacteraceae bacterium]
MTFTAVVSGMNPTGNITFFDGDSAIRGCASIPLGTGGTPAGAAQCSTGTLLPATHSITAAYTGDVANAPSLSAVRSQVVNGAPGARAARADRARRRQAPARRRLSTSARPRRVQFRARARQRAGIAAALYYPGRGPLNALVTTRRPGAEAARLRAGAHRVSVGKLHDNADSAQTTTLVIPLTRHGRRILAPVQAPELRCGQGPKSHGITLSRSVSSASGPSARRRASGRRTCKLICAWGRSPSAAR